jgi:hypothetical protein
MAIGADQGAADFAVDLIGSHDGDGRGILVYLYDASNRSPFLSVSRQGQDQDKTRD